MVEYQYVSSRAQFLTFLEKNQNAKWFAFDTEFISEGRREAELCLLQVATERGNYILDPLILPSLTPFWELLCRDDVVSIVHAGRSELEFCRRAINRFPSKVFDVQLAAAFVGLGYPLSYKTLAEETIKVRLTKSETLTDWKRRPLLRSQLDYAINDVCHLKKIADRLTKSLNDAGRLGWFEEETQNYCVELEKSLSEESWKKISGVKHCNAIELALVRALWRWRVEKSLAKNAPPQRVMRDPVILNLAKNKTADPERIAVTRGINAPAHSPYIKELSSVVQSALNLPTDEMPIPEDLHFPAYELASQLVGVALGQYCRRRSLSTRLFMTSLDVREAIAAHEGTLPQGVVSKLGVGWRAEFLGDFLQNVLSGRYAMKLVGNFDDDPLELVDLTREIPGVE